MKTMFVNTTVGGSALSHDFAKQPFLLWKTIKKGNKVQICSGDEALI